MWLLLFAACHYNPPPGSDPGDDDSSGPDAGPIVDPQVGTCGVGGTALCMEFENGAAAFAPMDVALDGSGHQNDASAIDVVSTRRLIAPAVPDDRAAGFAVTSTMAVAKDLDIDQSFTIETWVQINGSNRNWLVDSNGRFFLSVDGLGGTIRCGINLGSFDRQQQLDSTTTIDFAWHHVACTFDQSTRRMRIFVDGSSANECADFSTTISPAPGATTIGVPHVNARSTDHLIGSLDSLRIYDHVLDGSAICSLAGGGTCQSQCSPTSEGGGGGFPH